MGRYATRSNIYNDNWMISTVFSLILGVVLGFGVTSQLRLWLSYDECHSNTILDRWSRSVEDNLDGSNGDGNLLFVGVMTAQKYLDSRALSIHETWAQGVPGRLAFFVGEDASSVHRLPLVQLHSVDDSAYPPQKKSFLMLKYLYENYLDRYEWFMRADDDVYVHTARLERFLRSINATDTPLLIGQAGIGNKQEMGLLSLNADENFCMGGPGVVMSRETLRRVGPHIRYCLKHLYSTHEDVEIGRCVRKFAGVSCTWSYEMQTLFYHHFSGEMTAATAAAMRHDQIQRSITLHPIKQSQQMYLIHAIFQTIKADELRHKELLLRRDLTDTSTELSRSSCANSPEEWCLPSNPLYLGQSPSINKFTPASLSEVIPWDFFTKHVFSMENGNPRQRPEHYRELATRDVIADVMRIINRYSRQRGRIIDFKGVLYGYSRVVPMRGVDYILDMLLSYRKYRGRKVTLPVRRHAYVQRAFAPLQIREVPVGHVVHQTINFILPLAGRSAAFERFMTTYETVCANESTTLTIVYFEDVSRNDSSSTDTTMREFENFLTRYPAHSARIVPASGAFSRARALELGAALFEADDLLFFIDVDMLFDSEVLFRVRVNTSPRRSVYFPIVFSEYDTTVAEVDSEESEYFLSNERGYWRQFGFGIVAIYRGDLTAVGGFDLSIQGWGKEDVELFTRVVASNLTTNRFPDPGLLHRFHPIYCDGLPRVQYEMCLGTKLSSVASVPTLAKKIREAHPDLMKQNF